mmetsp:Transcript_37829/g.91732  ORF Transcript_37829/g.91732 Transcript_37829/m.91732 type:complete len:214 (+) Transcript_37829:147-788(+)
MSQTTTLQNNQGEYDEGTILKQAKINESTSTQKMPETQESSAPPSPLRHDFITTLVATMNIPPYSMFICTFIYCCLLYTSIHWSWVHLQTVLVVYMIHGVLLDGTAQATVKPNWVQALQSTCNKNIGFRLTAKYFSCKLHPPSQKLNPDQSYLFAYHPHGIIGMGANLALSTDASGFTTTFPGVSGQRDTHMHISILCNVLNMFRFLTSDAYD